MATGERGKGKMDGLSVAETVYLNCSVDRPCTMFQTKKELPCTIPGVIFDLLRHIHSTAGMMVHVMHKCKHGRSRVAQAIISTLKGNGMSR